MASSQASAVDAGARGGTESPAEASAAVASRIETRSIPASLTRISRAVRPPRAGDAPGVPADTSTGALVAVASPLALPPARATAAVEEALSISSRALEGAVQSAGTDHPGTALLAVNAGSLYLELGETDRARELLEQALGTYERVYGPDGSELANVLEPLAVARFAAGDVAAAQATIDRHLDLVALHSGPQTDAAADVMRRRGWLESASGRTGTAHRTLRAALRIYERTGRIESEEAASAWLCLGVNELRDVDGGAGAIERAARYLTSGADVLEGLLPAGHPRLIALYRAMLDTPELRDARTGIERRLERHLRVVGATR